MSDLVNKVAELLNAPVDLVQRSAEARAAASGTTVDAVLSSWAGGESVTSAAPAAEAPKEETPVEEEVVEETPVEEEVVEETPVEEKVLAGTSNAVYKVSKPVSYVNETMDIKTNADAKLPRWLNVSFVVIPVFILIGLISASNTQECGERGILDIDRKSQQSVNCDGSPFEGKGVAATNTINYVALGQQVYSGGAACAGCHGAGVAVV